MDYIDLLPWEPPQGMLGYTLRRDKALAVLAYRACIETEPITGMRVKAVEVTCTECETTWIADRAGYRSCNKQAPSFGFINPAEGEGICYDGYVSICPYCRAQARVLHTSSISRYGKYISTHHPMSVHRVGDSIALVGWWIERTVYKGGPNCVAYEEAHVFPHEAYVLEGKKLIRFSAADKIFNRYRFNSEWEQRKKFYDAFGKTNIVFPPSFANMDGTKAENCKLDIYMSAAGDHWPVAYLNLWAKHPNVENILSSGAGALLADMLARTETYTGYYYSHSYADIKKLDISWKEVKPAKMLGLTTEEFRRARAENWTAHQMNLYKLAKHVGETPDYEELKRIMAVIGYRAKEYSQEGISLIKASRYLMKQGACGDQMLLDYRRMLKQHGENFTQAELWPGNLRAAHDRLVKIQKLEEDRETDAKFAECFELYEPLTWTDGELEIIIPRKNSDLYCEGKTLNHCVGSYGKQHISGKPIFFVRHHRRPERSYFTLNIDMRGNAPREIQLHGYGNESKGSKHWDVPQKVRDFVDRWEREILLPWFMKNKNKKENAA